MSKPAAKPILPDEVAALARAVVQADRFPQLATIAGDQPCVRPVSPVRTDGFTVYVANLRSYHKTAEIAANPKVELCYLDDHHDQVRLKHPQPVARIRRTLGRTDPKPVLLQIARQQVTQPRIIVDNKYQRVIRHLNAARAHDPHSCAHHHP